MPINKRTGEKLFIMLLVYAFLGNSPGNEMMQTRDEA